MRKVSKTVRWVEDMFIKHPAFALPGRKELINNNYDIILIDATEIPIERPKKKQKKFFYSGKKKRHSLKSQVMLDKKSRKIISTTFSNGRKHDFKLFKESRYYIHKNTKILTDTGYQGIKKLHVRVELPKKKSKNILLAKLINSLIKN